MNNIKKHIFIIGMMCSGKSSLAPILSKKLNIPFIDLDKDLISILGIDIQEMFDTDSFMFELNKELKAEGKKLGVNAWITKPLHPKKILDAINNLLDPNKKTSSSS